MRQSPCGCRWQEICRKPNTMKTFHDLKFKVYPREKMKISNGVIRNRELSQATPEEIKTVLEKQRGHG